jgi:hypothetical protein
MDKDLKYLAGMNAKGYALLGLGQNQLAVIDAGLEYRIESNKGDEHFFVKHWVFKAIVLWYDNGGYGGLTLVEWLIKLNRNGDT